MFGVLVVQKQDSAYHFLGTHSGKYPGNAICPQLTPSVFDDAVDDYFINKGMTAVTKISLQIKSTHDPAETLRLKEKMKQKSVALQQQLFESYHFSNLSGKEKNLLDIFKDSSHGNPPSSAGECAAPKLLQYAISHHLSPIALAEFWWGNPNKNKEKAHKVFYPACKDKCRPILEYMLEDPELFNRRTLG